MKDSEQKQKIVHTFAKIIPYVNTLEEIFEWSICKCLIPCERVKVKCPII